MPGVPRWHDAEIRDATDTDLASRGYGAVLWEPDRKTVRDARVSHFLQWLAARRGLDFTAAHVVPQIEEAYRECIELAGRRAHA